MAFFNKKLAHKGRYMMITQRPEKPDNSVFFPANRNKRNCAVEPCLQGIIRPFQGRRPSFLAAQPLDGPEIILMKLSDDNTRW